MSKSVDVMSGMHDLIIEQQETIKRQKAALDAVRRVRHRTVNEFGDLYDVMKVEDVEKALAKAEVSDE